jgi:hypothetical protein
MGVNAFFKVTQSAFFEAQVVQIGQVIRAGPTMTNDQKKSMSNVMLYSSIRPANSTDPIAAKYDLTEHANNQFSKFAVGIFEGFSNRKRKRVLAVDFRQTASMRQA